MNYECVRRSRQGFPVYDNHIVERIRLADTCSPLVKYQLLEKLKQIVADLRKGTVVFEPEELVPKMLNVGRARGTPEFEIAVKDLLATLAKKIPSAEYCQEFENYI
jgi:hypothetical protein